MGWFDDARTRVAKAIQGRPQGITDAQISQGMNNTSALGPGTPLVPYDGYSQTPRRMDYPVGVNLNQSGRQAWGRTSFETLDALIDAYSPARSAMNHKIDELKSMELLFNPADGFEGDAEDLISTARAVMARPDRVLPWEEWLSLFMEGMLRYDAGVLFKRRNMAGEVMALEVIDGSTVLPFIDEFGRRPLPPAPSYFQKIHGQVWNEFTTDNVDYLRFRPQLKSPFGLAPMESVLLSVNTDLRQQWNLLQMFTEGSVPAGFMTLPPDISSPAQVAQWQEYWDSFVLGDQSMLHKMIVIPNGSEFKNTTPQKFDSTFPEYLERLCYAAFQVVPQDLGATADVNRATGETQTDIQFRVNTLPWVRFLEGIVNRYLKDDIGLPVKVNLNTGRDTDDDLAEVQRWAAMIASGIASPDEARSELTGLPIDNENPIPRGFFSAKSGWQPLINIYAAAGPTDPETAGPILGATPLQIAAPVPGLLDPLPVQAVAVPDTVQKDDGGATAGVTTATGIAGLDLGEDEDEKVTKELAQFRTFTRRRIAKGSWRDFEFTAVSAAEAQALNREAANRFLAKATGTWSEQDTGQPQSKYDLKLASFYAPQIAAVIDQAIAGLDIGAAVGMIQKDSNPDSDPIITALQSQGLDLSGLTVILTKLYPDGWAVGDHAAAQQLGVKASLTVSAIDWGKWVPGNPPAADLLTGDGLQTLLDNAGVTIKGVSDSVLTQIGNNLATGVANGDSVQTMSKTIQGLGLGSTKSMLIAHTESMRAVMGSTYNTYQGNGVTEWNLETADDPDANICGPIADANPHPMSDTSDYPPDGTHPGCRCSASPVVETIDASLIQTVDADQG